MINSIFGITPSVPTLRWPSPRSLVSLVNNRLKTEKRVRILIPEYIVKEKKPGFLCRRITKIFQWIFFPLRLMYSLLCHCRFSDWVDDLPKPKSQGEFSPQKSFFVQARFDFLSFLSSIGASHPRNSLSSRTLPQWDSVDIAQLSDETLYSWGFFSLSGKELKFMANSLIVSYDSSIVSSQALKKILVNGSNGEGEDRGARGRMISSLAVSLRSSGGTSRIRKTEPLPYYRIYTSQFPDLISSLKDRSEFILENQLKQEYFLEIKRILYHFFKEAQNNGDDTLVLPSLTLETLVPQSLHNAAAEYFAEALKECIQKEAAHFKKIIYADSNPTVFRYVRKHLTSFEKVKVAQKNCLDVAHRGAKKGYRIAIFYPTDPGAIPGQFKPTGKITLSQMFGYYTTLLASQHPGCNPLVKKRERYVPFKKNAQP